MKLINKIALIAIPIYIIILMYNITLFCGNSGEGFILAFILTLLPFISGIVFREIIQKIRNKNGS